MKKRVYKYEDFLRKEKCSKTPQVHSFIREDNSNDCFIKLIFKAFELGKKFGKQGKLNKILINKISKGFFNVVLEIEKEGKIYKI